MLKDNPNCFCWKTYQCLLCEDIEKGRRILNNEGKILRVVKVSTPRVSKSRPVAVCGTRAGYNKHRRLGEPTCDECRQAQSQAVLKYYQNKKVG